MKKLIFILLLATTTIFSKAQNLVPNWSFEDTVACPFALTQIYLSEGWTSWRNTPDFFHVCTSGQASVPNNFAGYQFPKTGDAYSGFLTFAKFANNGREILGIKLIQSLIIGEKYYLSFYINNAINPVNYNNGASNKTGARLSTIEFTQTNVVPIDNYAHVFTDSLVTDSIGWFKVSGSFIADSAYQYIAFGNFFDDNNCTHIFFDSSASLIYYYIDDIKLSTDSNFVNGFENNYEADIIKIYRNLARDWIVVEGRNIKSIEAFDLCGRLILPKMSVSTFRTKVDISAISHGLYLLKVNTNSDSFIQKFVKH